MFEVRLISTSITPPQTVTILTPLNDWIDIEGAYADGGWVFHLDETGLWRKPSYFKFVLDGEHWMDDPYIRIVPAAGETYSFDESEVRFSMSSSTPTPPPAPPDPAPAAAAVPVADPAVVSVPVTLPLPVLPVPDLNTMPTTERAIINRVVVIATPFLTAGIAWLAAMVAKWVPGVTFDQTQLMSFMISIVVVCLAIAWKWLQGWQQHELLVAEGRAAPIKTKPTQTTQ
jgi:hypothetical protein